MAESILDTRCSDLMDPKKIFSTSESRLSQFGNELEGPSPIRQAVVGPDGSTSGPEPKVHPLAFVGFCGILTDKAVARSQSEAKSKPPSTNIAGAVQFRTGSGYSTHRSLRFDWPGLGPSPRRDSERDLFRAGQVACTMWMVILPYLLFFASINAWLRRCSSTPHKRSDYTAVPASSVNADASEGVCCINTTEDGRQKTEDGGRCTLLPTSLPKWTWKWKFLASRLHRIVDRYGLLVLRP